MLDRMYGTHSIRIGGSNDRIFLSLDSAIIDDVSWINPKFRYLQRLEALPENLVEITRAMNI